jgi:predicted metal-dependent peptidase
MMAALMKPATFSVADWIAQANIDLMRHPDYCAFSAVLTCGGVTLDERVPTACTDGWSIRINPTFAAGLPLPQLRFVMAHEAMHIAFQHLHVWQHLWKRDPQRTNIAADAFINLALTQADAGKGFLMMPTEGVQPEARYAGMSVGQIFDAMGQASQSSQSGGGSSGFDEHDWEGAQQGDAAQQKARDEAVQRAVRQGEAIRQRLAQGKGSAAMDAILGELTAPRLDWRALLRAFLTESCARRDESSWRRPSRRYLSQDVYMPSMQGTRAGELVIGLDTSGSCFGTQTMTAFVSEVQALVRGLSPERVHVIYWDARVTGHQTFDDGQFAVAALKPTGGGGTDGSVLFDYLRAKRIQPAAVIQYTDGEVGDWGRSDWPTVWAVTDKRRRAPHGMTMHLEI